MLVRLAADKGAVVAGAITVEGLHDVQVNHVAGLDHAIREGVAMRRAAWSGYRVDAFDSLRAQAKQAVVCNGDEFVLADSRADGLADVVIRSIDHGRGDFQTLDFL